MKSHKLLSEQWDHISHDASMLQRRAHIHRSKQEATMNIDFHLADLYEEIKDTRNNCMLWRRIIYCILHQMVRRGE